MKEISFFSKPNEFAAQKLSFGESGIIIANNDALAPQIVMDGKYHFSPVMADTAIPIGAIIFCNGGGAYSIFKVLSMRRGKYQIFTNNGSFGWVAKEKIYGICTNFY